MNDRKIPYGILPDWAIREYIKIEPYSACVKREGVISYGLSSMGYDIRLGYKFKIFSPVHADLVIDPKKIDHRAFVDFEGDTCLIPANSFCLAEALEYIEMPCDTIGICLGKSTYARCAVIPHCTPLEPSWKGTLTIEISNTSPLPARVYAGEGMIQVVFFRSESPCESTYASKGGIYQSQTGLTLAKVRDAI